MATKYIGWQVEGSLTHRLADRQAGKRIEWQSGKHVDRQVGIKTFRQAGSRTLRLTGRQTAKRRLSRGLASHQAHRLSVMGAGSQITWAARLVGTGLAVYYKLNVAT